MNERNRNRKINKTALNCWMILDVVLTGLHMYQSAVYGSNIAYTIIFTAIAVLPLLLVFIVNNRQSRHDLNIRYFMAAGFLAFYAFSLFTSNTGMVFLYIIPMISILTIYTDTGLLSGMYGVAIILNILHMLAEYAGDFKQIEAPASIIRIACLIMSGMFLFSVSKQNREQFDKLRNNVLKDTLTDAYNRKFIDYKMDQIIEHGKNRFGVSLAAIDIDDFKQFNSMYGHDLGDMVLIYLCNTILDVINHYDGVYLIRTGGDEFIILTSSVPFETFVNLMSDLNKEVAHLHIKYDDSDVRISICAGVSDSISDNLSNYLDMYKKADERLYLAKNGGKNMVIHNDK